MSRAKYLVLCDLQAVGKLDKRIEYIVPGDWATEVPSGLGEVKITLLGEPSHTYTEIEKQHSDVSALYDRLLGELSDRLNRLHGENFSSRGWEIILGPWLKVYLDTLHYRWGLVERAIVQKPDGVFVHCGDKEQSGTIPPSRERFVYDKALSTNWNQFIMSDMALVLLKKRDEIDRVISCECISQQSSVSGKSVVLHKPLTVIARSWIKASIRRSLEKVSGWFSSGESILISAPYLSLLDQLKIAWRIKRWPVLYFVKRYDGMEYEEENRSFLDDIEKTFDDGFPVYAARMVRDNLPSCYVEGWSDLLTKVESMGFPACVKIIYCSSNPDSDEWFRIYIAKQVNQGTELVISQHGGNYGVTAIPLKGEFVEHRVADRWVSWGWSSNVYKNVVPGPNVKLLSAPQYSYSKNGGLLLALPSITNAVVRLINTMPSEWIAMHVALLSALNDEPRKRVLIRAKPPQETSPYVRQIASGGYQVSSHGSIYHALRNSRLIVCTSYSTTMFESLGVNFPTIILLIGYDSLFRKENKPYMQQLQEAGILFTEIEVAANKINEIWNDVESWWFSDEVQTARKTFCERYSSKNEQGINYLAQQISHGI